MAPRDVLATARGRLGPAVLGRIVQAAVAAALAWELALQLPDHGRPFFAPIAAVIALGAAVGRRGRQAIEMATGVTLGILVGAALVAIAGAGAWQILVATVIALVLATAGGAPPIVRNQAAASAILVVALHQPGTNLALQRLLDALIGGAIALAFARVLFPVHPVELVRGEARALRASLAAQLDEVAVALADRDRARAHSALEHVDAIDEHSLAQAVMLARDVTRRAPRRRPLRRRIEALGAVYRELEASVSDAHAVATGAIRLLDRTEADHRRAAEAVTAAAVAVRAVEPTDARAAAQNAREAGDRLRAADDSLGAGVVAHAVVSIADHALREADAREEERRLAAGERHLLRSATAAARAGRGGRRR
jgi:uncharacterized membrane protein YgaE (UPF0421/DUF939 family)